MNKNIKIIIGAVILVGVVWLGYNYSRPSEPVSKEPIKIGVLLCLTGNCAEWGENSLKGIQMAADEINTGNGILGKKIKLIVQDSQEGNAVANAVSAYQQLIRDGIKYIIGPTWTPAGLALYPLASKDSVIITSPSLGVAEFNEASDNIFNTWPHDSIATKALAAFAIKHKLTRAAIFSSKQPWEQTQGNIFEKEFKRLGGTVVLKIEPHESTRDLRTEAMKIKNANPDVVMFSNFTHMGIGAKELFNLGYRGSKLSILMDDSRVELAQGGLENTVFVQYAKPSQGFIANFVKKYNKEPGITADTAYDALKIYAQAINNSGTDDVKVVKKAMLSMKKFQGASGSIVFDGKGGVLKTPVFWTVKDIRLVRYKE